MSEIRVLLDEEVAAGNIPGYSYGIYGPERILESGFGGLAQKLDGVRLIQENTLYDVASLTKPIVTATSFLLLKDTLSLDLELTLNHIFGADCPEPKKSITLFDLLAHRSGYPAWEPLYLKGRTHAEILSYLLERPLVYKPGKQGIYSCLGYILLGFIFPRLSGQALDTFAQQNIFQPLQMSASNFRPAPDLKSRIAGTEMGNEYERKMIEELNGQSHSLRDYLICGEVHDGNAFFLGGVAGNAGLFSTVEDVGNFSRMLVGQGVFETIRFLSPEAFQLLLTCHSYNDLDRFGLGWHLFSEGWSGSQTLSPTSFGHTGFTGCALWVDPQRNLAFVLLTNRVHPRTDNDEIRKIRKQFINLSIKKHGQL
ncbi:serine hydrolase domain-containing protein [candidate division CSSED10-310 bacterium]|uniref:Serine hydrolase domain-containing protein n=1 Tax=candidate division CSSED10-310 bacterium TaxID=2855610 RepID=A0ABV6YXU0_UNCC1